MSIQFIYDDVLEKKKKALNEIIEEIEPRKKAPPHTLFLRRWLLSCYKASDVIKEKHKLPHPPIPIKKIIPIPTKNPFEIKELDRANINLY